MPFVSRACLSMRSSRYGLQFTESFVSTNGFSTPSSCASPGCRCSRCERRGSSSSSTPPLLPLPRILSSPPDLPAPFPSRLLQHPSHGRWRSQHPADHQTPTRALQNDQQINETYDRHSVYKSTEKKLEVHVHVLGQTGNRIYL